MPTFTASFNGFVLSQGPSSLDGTLGFSVNPMPAVGAVGNYAINLAGLNSNNYAITYVPGTLSIGGTPPGQNQPTTTATTELTGVNNGFGGDPSNGLTPLYFL